MGKRVNEIAKEIDKKPSEVIRRLEQLGIVCNVNTVLTESQEQMLYDAYRIKRPSSTSKSEKSVTISAPSSDSPSKTVVIKAPAKSLTKDKGDEKDRKPVVVVVKTTKDGETKSTIRHIKHEEKSKKPEKEASTKKVEKAEAKVHVVKTKTEEEPALKADILDDTKVKAKVEHKADLKTDEKVETKVDIDLDKSPKVETKEVVDKKTEKKVFEKDKRATFVDDKTKSVRSDRRDDKRGQDRPAKDSRQTGPRPTGPRPTGATKDDDRFKKPGTQQAKGKPYVKRGTSDEPAETIPLKHDKARTPKKDYGKKPADKSSAKDTKKETSVDRYAASRQDKFDKNLITPKSAIDTGKLTDDDIFNTFYNDGAKRRRRKKKEGIKPQIEVLKFVKLPPEMTVKEFAEKIKKTGSDVLGKLLMMGADVMSINENIDFDTAALVADEYGITSELENIVTEEDILFDDEDDKPEDLQDRPPVVVVMGHVDHGKTSLLDYIKNSNVAQKEAGRITQHIGAYKVKVHDKFITFLDTPGHEAFTSMRKRGADVTDIAIITVAADDGIMPQTIEAINHAKAANVTIIIAINKIDLPAANPDRVMQQLMEHSLIATKFGGEIECIPVSAKTGQGVDDLLETILLSAEILELKANPNSQAKGIVLESRVERAGTITTLLIQRGTLQKTDYIISGTSVGNIKVLYDDRGKVIESAGPSMPVEILGLDSPPDAGEIFYAVNDERTAKSLAERRKHERQMQRTTKKITTLDDLFEKIQAGDIKDLNIIVKADVQGSVEALSDSLVKLSTDEVRINVVHAAVGTITETDVSLAEVSGALIVGFNVRPLGNVNEAAKQASVDIRLYNVIYDAIEDLEKAMKGMLEPKTKEVVYGHAEVREIFKVTGVGSVAGCMVLDGKIFRKSKVRLVRDGITVYDGVLSSLKRFKDDVREVAAGYECGMSIERFNDLKINDIIESYNIEVIKEWEKKE